ncbi:MAG: hypothetical protein ACQETR_04955 [Thermodesulfobacteriota bacterium]
MVGWVEERNPTLTWEPYIGKEIKNNGYVAVFVKEAFRRGGLEADHLNKDAVKDDLTNFKKLAAGRLDLVVADKFVGLNLIKKHMPDKAGQIEFMAKFLGRSTIVLFFLKLHFDNPFFTRYRWVPRMATRTTMAFLLLDDRVLRFCQICQTKVNKYKIK